MQSVGKMEVAAPEFFSAPPRKVRIETVEETGRVYFLLNDKIVAVAKPAGGTSWAS